MIWVSWRQQRTETLIAAAIIALLAALLVPTGIEMANAFDRDGLSACLGQNASEGCGSAIQSFLTRYEWLDNLTSWFTLVPGLIGVLLAASVRARARERHLPARLDAEHHAPALDRHQARHVHRRGARRRARDDAARHLVAHAARRPEGRMENSVFDFEGTVAVGYVLFALGLALAVGAVWRRTVPALVVAFVGYVAARVFVDTWLRQRFQAPLAATWRESADGGARPRASSHAWVLDAVPERQARPARRGHARGVRRARGRATFARSTRRASSSTRRSTCTRSTSPRAASGSSRGSRPRCSAASRSC